MISPRVLLGFLAVGLSFGTRVDRPEAALRLEHVDDATEDLMFTNVHDVPMRILEVNVYACERVTSGCGTTAPDLNVPAHHTVRLRRMSVTPDVWMLEYDVRWRPAPARTSASVVLQVPASGPAALLVAPLALTTLGYHAIERSRSLGVWHMVNIDQRISLWVEQARISGLAGTDSVRIDLSGARIPRNLSGFPVADEDHCSTLTNADTADQALLQGAALAVQRAESAAVVATPDTAAIMHAPALWLAPRTHRVVAHRNLGRGRWAVCRYSAEFVDARVVVDLTNLEHGCEPPPSSPAYRYNAFVTATRSGTPIGQTLETCAAYTVNVPDNWTPVEWYRDPSKCPADGPAADSTQPNILMLKRLY